MPFFRVFQLPNPWTDFQNILYSWLRRWPHPTCKYLDQSAQRKRVCTCVKFSSSGVYFFSSFLKVFFSFMRIATSPPIGPINAVNDFNDAFWWHAHSLYGLVKEIWKLPPSAPKIWKFALRPMATSKRHNSSTVKDTCKMFAPNRGFSGSGNQTVSFKFLLDPPLLPWQHADVIWRQNRPLLSLYKRYHQDSCTK